MDVRLPDGTIIRGVPDGTSKADLTAKLMANGYNVDGLQNQSERSVSNIARAGLGGLTQQTKDLLLGGLRGAGSIGATLLSSPDELRADFLGTAGGSKQRRQDMTDATRMLGADPESLTYGAGKLGTEVIGTLGVPGAVGGVVGRGLPTLGSAIASSGMKAGGVQGMASMLPRVAGGAVAGGAAAGLIDPNEAKTGTIVGGALPPALALLGKTGSAIGLRFGKARDGSVLADALGMQNAVQAAQAAAKLKAARELVAGSRPTVAQVLRTPEAGTLERVIADTKGGMELKRVFEAQNLARLAALERVAPTNPLGAATARQELGDMVSQFAKGADKAARSKTSAAFDALPLDDASMYLPLDDMAAVQRKYFGPGSIGGDEVATALAKAREIGEVAIPATKPVTMPQSAQPMTLAQAVRKAGGISLQRNDGLRGELIGLKGDLKNLVKTNGGRTPGDIAQMMHQRGYLPDENASTLLDALRNDATGVPQFSVQDDLERMFAARRDGGVEAMPAGVVPKTATLAEVQNLSSSIKSMQRAAAATPGKEREAAALGQLQESIENKINQVIAGDGRFDEVLPLELVQNLEAARKLKADQVTRFRTGPQADIFRKGADGQPLVEGQQVAAKFWRTPEDVRDFKRLIDGNEKLLGQFRSMVTTEGSGTQTRSGTLTSKFVKWVDNSLPKLRESFDENEVKTLRRIAADIKRAESAVDVGRTAAGSDTYQKAQHALSMGLLDNPLLQGAAERIPFVGRYAKMGLGGMSELGKAQKARALAGLLSDPQLAGASLAGWATPVPSAGLLEFEKWLSRAAPAIAADQ